MNQKPLISVITPSFNSEKYIALCIDSVISQTYVNWELLIVDGESKDCTGKIVSRFAEKDQRVRLINNSDDDGPAQARAFGLTIAAGTYVAFIDSDDLWLPNKLQQQLSFMLLNGYLFTFTRYRKMRPDVFKRSFCDFRPQGFISIQADNLSREVLRFIGDQDVEFMDSLNTFGRDRGRHTR